jgi:hypothetical protein
LFCAKQRTKNFSKKIIDKLKKRVYSCLASKARGQKQKQKKIKKPLDKQASICYNVDSQESHNKRKAVKTMSKKVDFTHEERAVIMRYLQAKADKAKAEKAEKDAKAAAKELFSKLGKEFKTTDKTSYLYGTVQVQGKAKPVVYKETTAKGTIDWQAYAMALGGTEEQAEAYRKPSNPRTSLDWATKAQEEEING